MGIVNPGVNSCHPHNHGVLRIMGLGPFQGDSQAHRSLNLYDISRLEYRVGSSVSAHCRLEEPELGTDLLHLLKRPVGS